MVAVQAVSDGIASGRALDVATGSGQFVGVLREVGFYHATILVAAGRKP